MPVKVLIFFIVPMENRFHTELKIFSSLYISLFNIIISWNYFYFIFIKMRAFIIFSILTYYLQTTFKHYEKKKKNQNIPETEISLF